ncbi:MAG: dihydrolipoyl dehydrogenase [Pseudomonadota bacterium]|jgi:dihydrolipoamide dehydrogenase
MSETNKKSRVLVLGAGPGGYTAAFRAADLGMEVTLVERHPTLGGVCLNVGCIPSKALLHTAKLIHEAQESEETGVAFGQPHIDLEKIRANKNKVVGTLTAGLTQLAKVRKVRVVQGEGAFTSSHSLKVTQADGSAENIDFDYAIIAAGSRAIKIPGFPEDPRLMDSTAALALEEVPGSLLIVGGGIIGLEMACVYHALGARISVVELQDQLVPGCDADLVRPLHQHVRRQYDNIWLKTRVSAIEARPEGLHVSFEGDAAPVAQTFDRVLVAVGRQPNGHRIAAEAAGVQVDERGFIAVDRQQRTNVPHIFAIGDIVGNPMLAHKATHEAKVAAEVIAGHKSAFQALTIPSVAYTDPEIAWMGLTETEALARGIPHEKAVFPWAASGRALGIGRKEGLTKLICDPETHRVLGAGIVGVGAGDLIAEAVLALEMGADAEDMALTIHPHPTLSETLAFAAEIIDGTITDLPPPRRKS